MLRWYSLDHNGNGVFPSECFNNLQRRNSSFIIIHSDMSQMRSMLSRSWVLAGNDMFLLHSAADGRILLSGWRQAFITRLWLSKCGIKTPLKIVSSTYRVIRFSLHSYERHHQTWRTLYQKEGFPECSDVRSSCFHTRSITKSVQW